MLGSSEAGMHGVLPGVYNCVGINTCLASSLGYVCFHCSVDAKPNGIALQYLTLGLLSMPSFKFVFS